MEIALEVALSPIKFMFMNSMLPASDFSAHRNPLGKSAPACWFLPLLHDCQMNAENRAQALCRQRLYRLARNACPLASVTALPYSWCYCPLQGPSIPIPTNPLGVASQLARNHLKRHYLQALYLDVSMLSSVEGVSRLLCSGSRT